jgi:hypothetical protein
MKFTRFIVPAALTLLVAVSTASANLNCPGLTPVPFSSIDNSIDLGLGQIIQGKDIDCNKVAIGANVVSGIQNMVAGQLPAPHSITFRMVDQFDNAFFDPSDISLNVPYQLVLNNYSKNPVYSPAVWAHEFGHSILDATLTKINADSKWTALISKTMDGSIGSPEGVIQALLMPYHEFFADCVAVLYTGKPDAVAKGLYLTGFMANPEGSPSECPNKSSPKCRPRQKHASDPRIMATSRDFAERSNQLGTWKGVNPGDDHDLLAPARFHIWKYYYSNALMKAQKGKLAGVTVDAILSDMNGRLQRVASLPGGFTSANVSKEIGDVQRINREFIDTVNAEMKKSFPSAF